ncbi:hypothetical protein Sango_1055400 [Sesamum angolense]|uniref:Uncharacterized protein n=1 Tax=Sesamum angolense TaxID=2727404 RepID=A0AAE1X0N5_9LAMI|nr:hypothetical protein Sango_1055400 [Sesamum angolense]
MRLSSMTLKHQKGRLSLDDLMIAISIEEEHKTHKMLVEHQSRANLIMGNKKVNKATNRRTVSMGNSNTSEVLRIGTKVLVPKHNRKKLGPETVDIVFLDYVETSYALRFLVIKSEIPSIEINTIVEFCDAVFREDVFPIKIGIPSSVSLDDSLASTSIPEHVEKMSNEGVKPSSTSPTH